MVEPLYRSDNCQVAYQLNWSLSVFLSEDGIVLQQTIENLRPFWEVDGVRVLEFVQSRADLLQFFVSSLPSVAPSEIVRRIKGRLQHAVRGTPTIKFRRNYQMNSLGSASAEVLDRYVQNQPAHHPMAQERVQSMFEELQFHDASIDLAAPRTNAHGRFVVSLHLVVESEGGWRNVRRETLEKYVHSIRKSCEKHRWLLSRAGVLANHIHVLLGADVTDCPESVALSLMNNLAFSQSMKPIFKFSYYIGTFGPYDRGAIWKSVQGMRQGW
jgi:REP element-mobilizing transposase RayT